MNVFIFKIIQKHNRMWLYNSPLYGYIMAASVVTQQIAHIFSQLSVLLKRAHFSQLYTMLELTSLYLSQIFNTVFVAGLIS